MKRIALMTTIVFASLAALALGDQEGLFTFEIVDGNAIITAFDPSYEGAVGIPETLGGYPVTTIGDQAFYGCSLTSVTIGNSVTTIGLGAFEICSSLTSVTILDSVTTIGGWAFTECGSLTSVTIPDSVTTIGPVVFGGCSSLTNILAGAGNSNYTSIDGVLFDKSATILIQYPGGRSGPYIVPAGVTAIPYRAFNYCGSLTSVAIPNSVTTIGDFAFTECGSLTSVTIGNSVTTIGAEVFEWCSSLRRVYFKGDPPAEGGSSIFWGCDYVTVYYLPGSTGWEETYAGSPAVLWNPSLAGLEVRNGRVFLSVTGTPEIPIRLQVTSDLQAGAWETLVPLSEIGGDGSWSYEEEETEDAWMRFYRIVGP